MLTRKYLSWLRKTKESDPTGRARSVYVARRLGLSPPEVSKYLGGKGKRRGDPSLSTIERIARHLKLRPHQVLHMIEEGIPPTPELGL